MAGTDVHTVHKNGAWINEVGGEQVDGNYATKETAIAAGRELAMRNKSEHVIHGLDGQIHERSSYGHDPRDTRG